MSEKDVFVIAEVGQAHEGSLGMALSYIEALAGTGVHAIKFQVHIAEAESSLEEPFRIKFSQQDATRFDYWKRMEFTKDEWHIIKNTCEKHHVEFIASPFSNAAVDLLEEIGIKRYKIGSGEVNNFLLLEKISNTGKPLILSSGMSSFEELDAAVKFLKQNKVDLSLLQCTTSYPTEPENYGLNIIKELRDRYHVPVGFSDHSAKISTGIAAVALGAEILEVHAVFDRRSFGPDSSASLEIDEIEQLVSSVQDVRKAVLNPVDKSNNHSFFELKKIFEKSLAVNKDLPVGHILQYDDLEAKKPKGYGIPAEKYQQVVGRELKVSIRKWEFLKEDHFI